MGHKVQFEWELPDSLRYILPFSHPPAEALVGDYPNSVAEESKYDQTHYDSKSFHLSISVSWAIRRLICLCKWVMAPIKTTLSIIPAPANSIRPVVRSPSNNPIVPLPRAMSESQMSRSSSIRYLMSSLSRSFAAISSFRIFPYCCIEESAVNKRINDLEPRLQFSG